MRIIEYYTATGIYPGMIVEEINRKIEEGYQPWGSPYSSQIENQHYYNQAMVKYDEVVMPPLSSQPLKTIDETGTK